LASGQDVQADEAFKREVGDRLRSARRSAKISVSEMAERLSVQPSTVYAYERGQNLAPFPVLIAYAAHTRRSVDDFAPPQPPNGVFIIEAAPSVPLQPMSNAELVGLLEQAVDEVSRRLP